jgi:hypothetical protein
MDFSDREQDNREGKPDQRSRLFVMHSISSRYFLLLLSLAE